MGTGNPVYLSIDIDTLDPACEYSLPKRFCFCQLLIHYCCAVAPATGTQEPGGWSTRELRTIIRGLDGLDFIGADIVEVAPAYDTNAELSTMYEASLSFFLSFYYE